MEVHPSVEKLLIINGFQARWRKRLGAATRAQRNRAQRKPGRADFLVGLQDERLEVQIGAVAGGPDTICQDYNES